MVWPEVMLEYETTEKYLSLLMLSANLRGYASEDWTCEARRYYFNIVGKYGAPVQTLLKKVPLGYQDYMPLYGLWYF